MERFTDRRGKNPLPGAVIRELILGDDFMVAWYTVAVYIMQMSLQDFHKEMMRFRNRHKQTLIMAGRGFGKSYLLNTAWTLTVILRDPHVRIAVATQSLAQSKKFVGEMKRYFEDGTTIYRIFGNLKGDIWTETQFSLKRDRVIKESTVSAGSMGASANFISSHFDILILDDIVGEENSATKAQRDKLKNFIFNTVLPTLEMQNPEYGMVHCIGTHYHADDFWTTIMDSGQYEVLKKPSLFPDKKTGKERSIWEWKKGVEELKKIRALVGSIIFNMQYQQKVSKNKGGIFKAEWLQYFHKYTIEKDGAYVYVKTGEEERRKVRLYAGCDLAISQKATADYFVMTIIGIDTSNNIYVLDYVRKRLSFHEQIETIIRMATKWELERIGVESVAYQQALYGELMRTTMLPVTKIQTTKDKVTRMNIFSGAFENYKVFFYQHMQDLHVMEEELLNFPEEEHDDIPDSIEIAWQTAKKNTHVSTFDRDMFNF